MRNIKAGAIAAIALTIGGTAIVSQGAFASPQGSRNTAVVLGAGAVYELTQHNTAAGLLLGVGAVIADQQAQRQSYNDNCHNGGYYQYNGGGRNDWDRGNRNGWDRGNGNFDQDRDHRDGGFDHRR